MNESCHHSDDSEEEEIYNNDSLFVSRPIFMSHVNETCDT